MQFFTVIRKYVGLISLLLICHGSIYAQSLSERILFSSNEHVLTQEHQQQIEALFNPLASDSILSINVLLIGRTDSIGSEVDNISLAKKRVTSVEKFIQTFPNVNRVSTSALGEKQPLENNNIESGRIQNRSVEIYVDIVKQYITPIENEDTIVVRDTIKEVSYQKKDTASAVPEVLTAPDSKEFKTLKKGKKIRLKNIEFVPGSVLVKSYSWSQLNDLLYVMRTNPTMKIEIRGHVCCKNDEWMSRGRAETVRKYLVANGIEKSRMKIQGFSNRRPIRLGLTQKGKQRNRRVEIKILEI